MMPVHPGRILKMEMEARELTANALALKLRVPSNRISGLVGGTRNITAETAMRLGQYFGNSAQFWLNLQTQYDLAILEREKGDAIRREVETAT